MYKIFQSFGNAHLVKELLRYRYNSNLNVFIKKVDEYEAQIVFRVNNMSQIIRVTRDMDAYTIKTIVNKTCKNNQYNKYLQTY